MNKSNRTVKEPMFKRSTNILFCIAILTLLYGCSVKEYIPEDELLYTGAEVEVNNLGEIDDVKAVRQEVEQVLRPEPNSTFLGMRIPLLVHYKAQRENPGFINRFLNNRIGEEPVYASDVQLAEVEDIILNRLENRGFFYSSVSSTMYENEEEKEAEALYTIDLPSPYLMEEYQVDPLADTLQVYQRMQENIAETVLEPGMRFDLNILKQERERIESHLKKSGYYNFNPQFLIFEADTNQYNNRRFDLFLRVKEEVPREAIIPYRVTKVNVYPNYVVGNDTLQRDTTRLDEKNFIQEEVFFRPDRLAPYILIDEGELYDPEDSRYTSRRLTSIGAYKFINIRYDEIDSLTTDSLGILEANIYLSPLNKRSLRAELQGVSKSNDFVGPTLALTYTNRNLFHGGEILNLTGRFGYEWQLASGDQRSLSSINIGAEADLIFPRMLFPVSLNFDNDWFQYSIPKTRISLAGNYLSRTSLFRMYSITGRFGYVWRANRFITHELNPLSINYVNLAYVTPEFDDILANNPYLRNSFDQQFIAGLTYSFTYNGMVDENRTHQFFINANLDLAGNALDLLSSGERPRTFLGLRYAQYAKLDTDIRYHFRVGSEQTIASRIFAGYGMPYGNSETMPFSKQYFSGGPYSVRAFRIRSLGPGSYDPQESANSYFDQAGNIRLEANVEYRFPIISFLKGAFFADAGNVWHTLEEEDQNDQDPGGGEERSQDYLNQGRFSSDFLQEFGAGVGFGLRVDIQNFVIRFDLAAPVRTPWREEGNRWHFAYDSPVLNFGIGYPF